MTELIEVPRWMSLLGSFAIGWVVYDLGTFALRVVLERRK